MDGPRFSPTSDISWKFACHSILHGRTVRVGEWDAKIYKTPSIIDDGVIVIPITFEVASVCPVGLCECGACGAFWIANHNDKMYWNDAHQWIVCGDCRGEDLPFMMVTTLQTHVLRTDPIVGISYEEEIDEQKGHVVAKESAVRRNLHYFEGKSAMDLYHDLLAKRVARRWRRAVKTKLFVRTAWVLYSSLGFDRMTCAGLARRAICLY